MDEVYIMLAVQDSDLMCGLHVINNMLQGNFVGTEDLAAIAQSLDQQQLQLFTENVDGFGEAIKFLSDRQVGNVDAEGNFSIQVLCSALQNLDYLATPWISKNQDNDPELEQAFLINLEAHWFALRKINERWWILDSLADSPRPMTYLKMYLMQIQLEGYSVYVVRGPFNPMGSKPWNFTNCPPNYIWFSEWDLLSKS